MFKEIANAWNQITDSLEPAWEEAVRRTFQTPPAPSSTASSFSFTPSAEKCLKTLEKGNLSGPPKQSSWSRAGSALKGFLWQGPQEMVRGLLDLTPAKEITESTYHLIHDPDSYHRLLQTPEGKQSYFHDQLRMIPGIKPVETLGQIALHPVKTWQGIKHHYQEAWKTDEGKGKIGFDAVATVLPFAKVGKVAQFAKIGTFKKIPLGVKDISEFKSFGSQLMEGLGKKVKDAEPFISGSSVTGMSYRTGELFDVGRVSDWDLAIVSPDLLKRVKKVGVDLRMGRRRTAPMDLKKNYWNLKQAGLVPLAKELSEKMGRPVTFMIYDSEKTIAERGQYLRIPKLSKK